MMPYFMNKACGTDDPLEKMKYVITSIVSSNYYMNLFMKPVLFLPYHSWTQLSVRPFKAPMPMELKFIVNKFPTILLSVTSW